MRLPLMWWLHLLIVWLSPCTTLQVPSWASLLYESVLMIGMERYPKYVMDLYRHSPNASPHWRIYNATSFCVVHYYLCYGFSQCWTIHAWLFKVHITSDSNQCRNLSFCHFFDSFHPKSVITLAPIIFSLQRHTPLGHIFGVTSF